MGNIHFDPANSSSSTEKKGDDPNNPEHPGRLPGTIRDDWRAINAAKRIQTDQFDSTRRIQTEESQVLKTTLATLVLVCCAAGLTTSATALAPCDGVKQCKIAQCQAAEAAKVAQVTSDKQAQCAAAKAARAASVAQVKSSGAPACCTAAKTAQVAQVKSGADCPYAAKAAQVAQIKSGKASACCAAAKATQVAQVKSDKTSQCCAAAAKAAQVAQVKSDKNPQCSATAKAAQVAQVRSRECAAKCAAAAKARQVAQVKSATANAKYVAFGCTKTDAAVRKAAYAYLKAVAQMQEKSGAKGCALEAASKTLATVVSEEMAKYQGQAATAKSDAPVVTSVSLGSVSGCGPDCTKACCTN